jgi:hypothetical protein
MQNKIFKDYLITFLFHLKGFFPVQGILSGILAEYISRIWIGDQQIWVVH